MARWPSSPRGPIWRSPARTSGRSSFVSPAMTTSRGGAPRETSERGTPRVTKKHARSESVHHRLQREKPAARAPAAVEGAALSNRGGCRACVLLFHDLRAYVG